MLGLAMRRENSEFVISAPWIVHFLRLKIEGSRI